MKPHERASRGFAASRRKRGSRGSPVRRDRLWVGGRGQGLFGRWGGPWRGPCNQRPRPRLSHRGAGPNLTRRHASSREAVKRLLTTPGPGSRDRRETLGRRRSARAGPREPSEAAGRLQECPYPGLHSPYVKWHRGHVACQIFAKQGQIRTLPAIRPAVDLVLARRLVPLPALRLAGPGGRRCQWRALPRAGTPVAEPVG